MAHNWLLELGIPFDPAPSQEEIARVLDEREREFGLKANKGERGSYYSVMLERLGSVRKELADEAALGQMAEEARRVSYPVIDQIAAQMGSAADGDPTPEAVAEARGFAQDLIADRAGIAHVMLPDGLVESRMAEASLQGSGRSGGDAQGARAAEAYRKAVLEKPKGQHKYRSFEADLAVFGVDNLYDYALGIGAPWAEMQGADPAELLKSIEAKVGECQKGTSERSAAERLSARGREVCAGEGPWKDYCAYLVWRDAKESLDFLGRMARLGSGAVPAESAERVIAKLSALFADAERAELVVRGYCAAQEPPLTLPKAGSASASAASGDGAPQKAGAAGAGAPMPAIAADASGLNLVTCPHCGKRTSTGSFCMECGKSLDPSSRHARPVAGAAYGSGAAGYGAAGGYGAAAGQPVQYYQQPAMPQQAQYQAVQSWPQQAFTQPPVQQQEEAKASKAPIVVASLLAVVAIALVAFVAFGGPSALTPASEPGTPETIQVDSSSMADCSQSTRITPYHGEDNPISRYRVTLSERPATGSSGAYSEQLMELNVSGAGGFSMQDFTKYGAALSNKMYQLTVTDSDTSAEYRLFVNYVGSSDAAPKEIALMC